MATKVFMEALSPTMEEGRLVKWNKNEGDAVKSGDSLAEVETDKAIMELVARGDGVLRKRLVNEGESRPVGALVGVIAAKDENIDALVEAGGRKAEAGGAPAPAAPAPAPAPAAAAPPPSAPRPPASSGPVRSSPLARRMAKDSGVELSSIAGSGPGGRIIRRDVEGAMTNGGGQRPNVPTSQRPARQGDFEDVALTQIRKTIAAVKKVMYLE